MPFTVNTNIQCSDRQIALSDMKVDQCSPTLDPQIHGDAKSSYVQGTNSLLLSALLTDAITPPSATWS